MEEFKGVQEIQTSLEEVKKGIVNNVSELIKKILKVNSVEINLSRSREYINPQEHLSKSVTIRKDGMSYGYIHINDPDYLSISANDREKLEPIGEMLAGQLHLFKLLDQPFEKFVKTIKENSHFKSELELAYSDLNTAHEELSEAYNLGLLLNRNLSRIRQEVNFFLEQAPIAFGILRHRHLKIEVANSLILRLWGKTKSVVGKPLSLALPELAGQPYLDILDEVYTTGKRYVGRESPVSLNIDGQNEVVYFNFIYEPLKNQSNVTNAIMIIANDVTSMVREKLLTID